MSELNDKPRVLTARELHDLEGGKIPATVGDDRQFLIDSLLKTVRSEQAIHTKMARELLDLTKKWMVQAAKAYDQARRYSKDHQPEFMAERCYAERDVLSRCANEGSKVIVENIPMKYEFAVEKKDVSTNSAKPV